MDASDTPPALQFDAVTPRATDAPAATAAMACTGCQAVLADEYFDVNGHSVCRDCSNRLASHAETPRGAGVLGRAAALGIAAAVLGAALYFSCSSVTGLEVGLVAIAIGFMVGYGVRLGTRGRGGRRFQVLALVLTYWAVGLAYSSLVVKELVQGNAGAPVSLDHHPADDDWPHVRAAGDGHRAVDAGRHHQRGHRRVRDDAGLANDRGSADSGPRTVPHRRRAGYQRGLIARARFPVSRHASPL